MVEKRKVLDADEFLEKAKEGNYPELENDAIELKQLLAKEKELKLLL